MNILFQIGIGFMSSLITTPITLIVIFLFRRSRLRKKRPSRISEALKDKNTVLDLGTQDEKAKAAAIKAAATTQTEEKQVMKYKFSES